MVTAAEYVYSARQVIPIAGGARGEALCGSGLRRNQFTVCGELPDVSAGMEAGSFAAVCEETAGQRRGGGRGNGQPAAFLLLLAPR